MQDEGGLIEPSFEVPVRLEPLPVEGKLQKQSLNDNIMQDCGLAGGTTYVTRDGGVGCAPAPMVTLPTNSGYQTRPPGLKERTALSLRS